MSKPSGSSLLDEFFAFSGSGDAATEIPSTDGATRPSRSPAPPSRAGAPPPPPSLRASLAPPPTLASAQPPAAKLSRSIPPPPPSKRRALAAEPISVGEPEPDEDRELDVDVSMSDEPALAKPDEAPVAEEGPPPESAAAKIRSMQKTVPGLSPIDALDSGWDAVASQIPAVEDGPIVAAEQPVQDAPVVAVERNEVVSDTDRSPSPARAVLDVPTPVVPIDFDGITREAPIDLRPVSPSDSDEQTVVRAEGPAAATSEDDAEAPRADESERVLAPVSETDNDEQTVVRAEPPTAPLEADELLTSPAAAPPPAALASPPPRIPVGSRRSAPPPPPLRASSRPSPGAPSLPPPPSFDRAGAPPSASKPSRPMPLPPRPSLPPPLGRSASDDGAERASIDAPAAAAPLLAPPSFTALSVPPPPPPAPPKRSSAPPPVQTSKRPSVPPPALLPPPPLALAATKIGPTENTPTTVHASTIAGRSASADVTPTVQVQRATTLASRPLPPPARVPAFSGVPPRPQVQNEPIRPKSSSIAPLVDSIPPPPGQSASRRYLFALAAITLGVAAIFFGLKMRSGSVVITVASESGGAVRDVIVKVDDVERCHATPCEVAGLEPGAHLVSASAAGLAPGAQRAFSIVAGGRAAEHVSLGSPERARAELSVAGSGEGLRVLVDGRDLGAPPVTIRDIEPGTHVVRVSGPGRLYEPYEETVRLEAGEARSLGPVRLKLLRGKLELLPGDGSDGASIVVDGHRVSHLPITLELSADQSHEVTAQRRGFADFSEEVVFDNTANKSLEVSLSPGTGSSTERPRSSHGSSSTPARRPPAASANVGGMATLDAISTPPANVVINGRPMGSSPLRNVRVPAGPQTVVFVHASLGRKIASTTVAPGGHGSVGVKF